MILISSITSLDSVHEFPVVQIPILEVHGPSTVHLAVSPFSLVAIAGGIVIIPQSTIFAILKLTFVFVPTRVDQDSVAVKLISLKFPLVLRTVSKIQYPTTLFETFYVVSLELVSVGVLHYSFTVSFVIQPLTLMNSSVFVF